MDEIRIRKQGIETKAETAARLQREKASGQSSKGGNSAVAGERLDTVDVALSKSIASELDPAKLITERKEKIERLKQAIASGEYNPSSDMVAAAVGQDILFEILDSSTLLEE
jgi:anti-sigma28 factor (negative regulator of flagellin synthesis)